MLYKEKVDSHSKSKLADNLSAELRELIIVCQENFHYTQELEKRDYTKGIKPRNYILSDKIWLNSKYIKTKQYQKLEAKSFLDCSKSYILLRSKLINWSFLKIGKFIIFFMYHC